MNLTQTANDFALHLCSFDFLDDFLDVVGLLLEVLIHSSVSSFRHGQLLMLLLRG